MTDPVAMNETQNTADETTSSRPTEGVTPEQLEAGRRAYDLDRQHVFHSWSAQQNLDPMTIVDAEGSLIWDGEGNRLVDFTSQLIFTNAGHQHPRIIQAIKDQADSLCTVAPQHANASRSEAARMITELLGEELNHVFFTNGGADANEHAVRMARLHTGRHKVLSAYRSYHGGTHLAINLTGDPRRLPSDHATDGVVHFLPAYTYRSHFNSTNEQQEAERALQHLDDIITYEGSDQVAAVVLEAIPGTAGIHIPPAGYLEGVRKLCDERGIMLILDEVMTGFGRTGEWFAHQHFDIEPDLLTFAKGVNSGYVPLGGVVMTDAIYSSFAQRVYPGGLTYSGHPLATAAAVATIQTMQDEQMVPYARQLGEEVIRPRLGQMYQRHPSIGDIRGVGAFWAIELVADRASREPLAPYGQTPEVMGRVVAEATHRGVLPFTNMNRIHIAPPLNISTENVLAGLDALDVALAIADDEVGQ